MVIFSFAAMIAAVVTSLLSLRSSRGDALGLPLIAIGSFSFEYILQPLRIMQSGALGALLTEWQIAKALIVPAIMLSCYMWGWRREPERPAITNRSPWSPRALWSFGFGVAMLGLCFDLVFLQRSGGTANSFSQAHSGAMAFAENTAYLYSGPWWMLSGSAMMILAASRCTVTGWRKASALLPLAGVAAQALLTGSRGPLFSVFAVLFVTYSITRTRVVPLKRAFALLAVAGVAVLLMVGFRSVLHLGTDKPEVPTLAQAFDQSMDISQGDVVRRETGQEFVLHAALLDTVDHTHKLDLGLGWVYFLVINPIPRLLWPEKRYPDTPGVDRNDILETTGITIAQGAAPGIVADLYTRFALGGALFFYWLGRLSRKLFISARRLDSPLAVCAYVMLYAVSLNVFAQEFRTIFVSFGYSIGPVVAFTVLSANHRGMRSSRAAADRASGALEAKPVQCL